MHKKCEILVYDTLYIHIYALSLTLLIKAVIILNYGHFCGSTNTIIGFFYNRCNLSLHIK